ncbi:hypothetical protein ABEB36_010747 [Hypothenemus hampei]|uniref:Nodal modulator 1 n=1 Tax=Hypothenemus hampei TaxID=57062 RepID=A0ABD1ECW9_HYPHA
MYIYTLFIIFLFKHLIYLVNANDVLGCGGFIKSHVPIDFSKVEVKLITKHGIVKDRTQCAPNNGYYFIPLYDKGELKLELSPPPGWSFTPRQILLKIDGTDPCSQGKDINFKFEGFGITGKVETLGNPVGGPSGVNVKLQSKEGVRTTQTLPDGTFSFSPVFPGSYDISISHPTWTVLKGSIDVNIKEGNTELPPNTLVIKGYDVTGKILTIDGKGIPNTVIALFKQKPGDKAVVDGCDKTEISEISTKKQFLCKAITSDSGDFIFPVVSAGNYFLAPYYKEQSVHFQPEKIEFSVQHSSVSLNRNFEVVGFTIPGQVINLKNQPIPMANILLDGEEVAKSDESGKYKLEKLKVGTYSLKAEADKVLFTAVTINVEPSLAKLPNLIPTAFLVCGKVVSDKSETVRFQSTDSSLHVVTQMNKNQEFCQYLGPGTYEVSVIVNEQDNENNVHFFPISLKIEVTDSLSNLLFSQLKSTIFGKIECITKEDCRDLYVILKADSGQWNISIDSELQYSATDILPGEYELTISSNRFCWNKSSQIVNINSETVEIPLFIQTGYQLQFLSAHDAVVTYSTLNKGNLVEIPITKGTTFTCLDSPGQYSLSILSCHEFNHGTVTYSTSSKNNEIILKAEKHTVELSIEVHKNYGPIDVIVKTDKTIITQSAVFNEDKYDIKLLLKPSEIANLTPTSGLLFFSPQTIEIEGSTDCMKLGSKFKGVPGKIFKGQINPPLSHVNISIENLASKEVYILQTNSKGFYQSQPLDSSFEYKITAQKNSYNFKGPDANGNFITEKLAEIIVKVYDEADNSSLAGVLLSFSGGQSYRKNLQTNSEGEITFHSLNSGEYFLRPMMKEYRFEPTSKIIKIQAEETVNVNLIGKRVAFSAFGKLAYVNEEPVQNASVSAIGLENCTGMFEEATTDASGLYRIRGLQPFCSFRISVQVASDPGSLVERTSPVSFQIDNVTEDVKDLVITAFPPVPFTDVLINVISQDIDHYKFLKLTIYREDLNPSVVYSKSLDNVKLDPKSSKNAGILINPPTLPFDDKEYSVHLEPFSNIKGKSCIHYFKTNKTFIYLELNFKSKSVVKEQPIKQTSIWTVIFVGLFFLIAVNFPAILRFLKDNFNFDFETLSSYVPNNKRSTSDYDNDIDKIVKDINNVKKHRTKKTN